MSFDFLWRAQQGTQVAPSPPSSTPPIPTPPRFGSDQFLEIDVPIELAYIGGVIRTADGRVFVVSGVLGGALLPSPGGGGTQRVQVVEVVQGDSVENVQAAVLVGGSTIADNQELQPDVPLPVGVTPLPTPPESTVFDLPPLPPQPPRPASGPAVDTSITAAPWWEVYTSGLPVASETAAPATQTVQEFIRSVMGQVFGPRETFDYANATLEEVILEQIRLKQIQINEAEDDIFAAQLGAEMQILIGQLAEAREGDPSGADRAAAAAAEQERIAVAREQIALDREQGEANLAFQQEQLDSQAHEFATESAQGAFDRQQANLVEALRAVGFVAPDLFGLGAGADPSEMQDIIRKALESGRLLPTTERLELIAEAAARPTDIVKLLFLSGGNRAPARRLGAFNMFSVFEEGKRAREDLAEQIAAAPRQSFDDLVQGFLSDGLPEAKKGAVISMKKGADGHYKAQGGATIVDGPAIFTVGEDGTEFALLAPGSVIAPKLNKDEPETMENARLAIAQMLKHGKRVPAESVKAAADGATVHNPFFQPAPGFGGPVFESELPLVGLERVLLAGQAAGMSSMFSNTGPSPSSTLQNLRLQMFGFSPELTFQQRATILAQSAKVPGLDVFLRQGFSDQAFDPDAISSGAVDLARERGLAPVPREHTIEGARQLIHIDELLERIKSGGAVTAQDAMAAEAIGLGGVARAISMSVAGRMDSTQLHEAVTAEISTNPEALRIISGLRNEVQQRAIFQGLDEGVPIKNFDFASFEAIGNSVEQERVQSAMEAIFGADMFRAALSAFREHRRRSFASSAFGGGGPARLSVF